MKNKSFSLISVLIIVASCTILGLVVGGITTFLVTNRFEENNKYNDNKYIDEFIGVYDSLLEGYYTEISEEDLINGAIDGMLGVLEDPYTTYMDVEETTYFNERMQGDYEGIGSYIGTNNEGKVIVSQPFKDSPAEKAGLKPYDVILEVNGENCEGLTTEVVASMIKGDAGTIVNIKIQRGEEKLDFSIERANIIVQSVTSSLIEKNNKKIGYIIIDIFSENSYEEFLENLEELEEQDIDSLIMDVRNNSGGYLDRVSKMVSLFLSKDKIIYRLKDKDSEELIYSYNDEKRSYQVAILINKYSASASEILAGAFKESYGAYIVGEKSYGKGTVQTTELLETGGMIKYTIQKWLTPNGNWINDVGIEPTHEVILNESYYNNPDRDNDNQLQKAIELLIK